MDDLPVVCGSGPADGEAAVDLFDLPRQIELHGDGTVDEGDVAEKAYLPLGAFDP